jgi:hypothetical protein
MGSELHEHRGNEQYGNGCGIAIKINPAGWELRQVLCKEVVIDYVEGEGVNKIEFKGTVSIKEMDTGEWAKYQDDITDIKFLGRMPQPRVDRAKMTILGIVRATNKSELVKTTYIEDKATKALIPQSVPYDISNYTSVERLPRKVGEKLFAMVQEMNMVNENLQES